MITQKIEFRFPFLCESLQLLIQLVSNDLLNRKMASTKTQKIIYTKIIYYSKPFISNLNSRKITPPNTKTPDLSAKHTLRWPNKKTKIEDYFNNHQRLISICSRLHSEVGFQFQWFLLISTKLLIGAKRYKST